MSLSITTTYAGEFAGKYVSAALLSGNTIANNLIEVKPNVKFKEVLKRVDYLVLLQMHLVILQMLEQLL